MQSPSACGSGAVDLLVDLAGTYIRDAEMEGIEGAQQADTAHSRTTPQHPHQ